MNKQDYIWTTPLARSLASKNNIDISKVKGSGFNGRVLIKDIENFLSAPNISIKHDSLSKNTTYLKTDEVNSITPIRKAIAKAMTNSWNSVAYTNLVLEVNMTALWNERKKMVKPILDDTGIKLTFLHFITKATIQALKEFSQINAQYLEKSQEIIKFKDINIGIAVDTPRGLMVPVIKQANDLSIVHLAKQTSALAIKARDNKLTTTDMSGGTFTITNYGSVGALYGVPVINFPEIAILGTGNIIDKLYMDNGVVTQGKSMHLTLAADHRWVDGADLGRFLNRIKELLENPTLLLILGNY